MRALATKLSTHEAKRRSLSQKPAVLFAPPQVSALFPAMLGIQRQPACPCGGGCPRCKIPISLQPKLKINEPNDRYEQEADRVAERVMRMPNLGVGEGERGGRGEVEKSSTLERAAPKQVQRKCAACASGHGLCPGCAEEEENIQAKEAPGQTPIVTPEIQTRIDSLRGGGQPLSESARRFFEPRFGHDFSRVRVHANSQAAESANAVNARAYTVGRDIVFGAGQYAPETSAGQSLLAHELTHIIQEHVCDQSLQRQETETTKLQSQRFKNEPVFILVVNNLLTLKKGKGDFFINKAVQKIQRALIDAGFPLPKFGPDGLYGSETEQAVREFQAFKQLPTEQQDGKVGPITLGLLDQHFHQGKKPRSNLPDASGSAIQFNVEFLRKPRYTNPDPWVELIGNAFKLNGPTYGSIAKVAATSPNPGEVKKWDIGHVQDITIAINRGIYANKKVASFQAPLPIRDAAKVEQQFPWYDHINPASTDSPALAPIMDTPHVQFEARHKDSSLERIEMKFQARDWVTARNRNTGAPRFLYHAYWGFDYQVDLALVTSGTPVSPIDPITPQSSFPIPIGHNDEITEGSGEGPEKPTMTERVYNSEVKFAIS